MYSDIGRQSAEPVGWVKSGCHLSFDALPYGFDVSSCVGEGTISCGSRLDRRMGERSSEASGFISVGLF